MNTPQYRPEQWVLYEDVGESGGFGRIVGAAYDGETWHYSVHGPSTDTTYASPKEDEITHVYESGSWIESHHSAGGQESAYAAPDPTLEAAQAEATAPKVVRLHGAVPQAEAEAIRKAEAAHAAEHTDSLGEAALEATHHEVVRDSPHVVPRESIPAREEA